MRRLITALLFLPGGVRTARRRIIAVGLVVMLLVAPFLWLIGFGVFLERAAWGFPLLGLALVTPVAGLGLLIYGLVAKSDLKRAALAREQR